MAHILFKAVHLFLYNALFLSLFPYNPHMTNVSQCVLITSYYILTAIFHMQQMSDLSINQIWYLKAREQIFFSPSYLAQSPF